MKEFNIGIIKDLIISLLIVVAIVLVLSVIFYDEISLSKVIPESEEYIMSEDMQEELDKGYINEEEQIITTYYIDAADLKKYENTKEYDKGKKNPFAQESVENTGNNTITNNEINSNEITSSVNNNTDTGFYNNGGIK